MTDKALHNCKIVLGVTGGIAAYKSAELIRLLTKAGADVRVVLTQGGKQFITSLTLQSLSGNKVFDDIFDQETELQMSHIDLARWADMIIIAPASADCVSKLAAGLAPDLLTTICLATQAPVYLAPAMNQQMWQHSATVRNINELQTLGYQIIGPASGEQACGEVGPGRMIEPDKIVDELMLTQQKKKLKNKRFLITAGPTQEPIDPVRFITNHSSGKMGFALAKVAASLGADVTLITGPTQLTTAINIERVDVTTATQMHTAVKQYAQKCDVFISAAAVADYQSASIADQKMKKSDDNLQLHLVKTPDIISEVATLTNKPIVVGFAAETENLIEHAQQKRSKKNLDMIVANRVSDTQIGFYSDDNAVTIITKNETIDLAKQSKQKIALHLLNYIHEHFLT